jgi:hypothetical protein
MSAKANFEATLPEIMFAWVPPKMFAFAHILLSTPTPWPMFGLFRSFCFDHAVSIMPFRLWS